MATKKQKQELIDVLKFAPITARILIQGYGGECYIGRVTRKQYEFYKKHKIDLNQYASDWDDDGKWDFIPDTMRIFPPGSPYDCDNLCHATGATMDDSSYITIVDENNNTIWESSLDISHLEGQGVDLHVSGDWESYGEPEGTVIFWGGQGEKGCFFDGEVILRAPFDPNKLRIFYDSVDGWDICSSVEYDKEEIEGSDGYSTTGKWSEYKFHIVGDEEVYEGEEISNDEDEEELNDDVQVEEELEIIQTSKIQWQPKNTNPPEIGEYDVLVDAPWPDGGPDRAEWTGKIWKKDNKKIKITQWGVDNDQTFDGIAYSAWHVGDVVPEQTGEYEVYEDGSNWPFPIKATWNGKAWFEINKEIKIKKWRGLNYNPKKV